MTGVKVLWNSTCYEGNMNRSHINLRTDSRSVKILDMKAPIPSASNPEDDEDDEWDEYLAWCRENENTAHE